MGGLRIWFRKSKSSTSVQDRPSPRKPGDSRRARRRVGQGTRLCTRSCEQRVPGCSELTPLLRLTPAPRLKAVAGKGGLPQHPGWCRLPHGELGNAAGRQREFHCLSNLRTPSEKVPGWSRRNQNWELKIAERLAPKLMTNAQVNRRGHHPKSMAKVTS